MTSSPNGNPSLSTLAYNGYGQTTRITPSGQAADTFSYAGPSQGERTGQGTSGASTSYVNGLTGVQSQATGTSSTLYERDPNGTLLSAQTTTSTTTTSSYFYFDGTGSVIGLLDDTGKQVAKYTYDPYGGHATVSGAEAADTSIATANIWRYARGQYDPATGLTKFGVRYYDPSGGRWTQLDPLQHLLDLRQGNRYSYAGSDPINNTDPTGACSFDDVFSCADEAEAYAAPVVEVGVGIALLDLAGATCVTGALCPASLVVGTIGLGAIAAGVELGYKEYGG